MEYIRGYSRLRSGHMHEHVRQYGYVGGKGNFHKSANANYKLNHMSFVFLNTVGASGAVLSLLIGNVRIDPKVSSTNEKSSEYHINLKHS